MIIIVGVILDTVRKLESQLLIRHYDGFMKKGKVKGRY
jgi:preprotein translocase subunit SecY